MMEYSNMSRLQRFIPPAPQHQEIDPPFANHHLRQLLDLCNEMNCKKISGYSKTVQPSDVEFQGLESTALAALHQSLKPILSQEGSSILQTVLNKIQTPPCSSQSLSDLLPKKISENGASVPLTSDVSHTMLGSHGKSFNDSLKTVQATQASTEPSECLSGSLPFNLVAAAMSLHDLFLQNSDLLRSVRDLGHMEETLRSSTIDPNQESTPFPSAMSLRFVSLQHHLSSVRIKRRACDQYAAAVIRQLDDYRSNLKALLPQQHTLGGCDGRHDEEDEVEAESEGRQLTSVDLKGQWRSKAGWKIGMGSKLTGDGDLEGDGPELDLGLGIGPWRGLNESRKSTKSRGLTGTGVVEPPKKRRMEGREEQEGGKQQEWLAGSISQPLLSHQNTHKSRAFPPTPPFPLQESAGDPLLSHEEISTEEPGPPSSLVLCGESEGSGRAEEGEEEGEGDGGEVGRREGKNEKRESGEELTPGWKMVMKSDGLVQEGNGLQEEEHCTPTVLKKFRQRQLEEQVPDDHWEWRKYGQKGIKDTNLYRAYYRCAQRHKIGCPATRHVDRFRTNHSVAAAGYENKHNHPEPPPKASRLKTYVKNSSKTIPAPVTTVSVADKDKSSDAGSEVTALKVAPNNNLTL